MLSLLSALSAVLVLGSLSPSPVERLSGSDTASQTALVTALTGDAEVPGPGDPEGAGMAIITLYPGVSQVCWDILVTYIYIAPATEAHIHAGEADVAGDVVFPLTPPTTEGTVSGCGSADAALIEDLANNPQGYYVNVHNEEYPDGALRGQLE